MHCAGVDQAKYLAIPDVIFGAAAVTKTAALAKAAERLVLLIPAYIDQQRLVALSAP